jgi:N utilization substance protein A
VDPVGACVGHRGARVQTVVNELKGEKIDIVRWSENIEEWIANALSPSKVISVTIFEDEKMARVVVPDHQLSLAIGKEGQNARLAAKLTNWKIDIKSESEATEEPLTNEAAPEEQADGMQVQEVVYDESIEMAKETDELA